MDTTGLTKGELAVHAKLTEELGDAIASTDVDAVKRLHSEWVEVHQARRGEIRRLKLAIQREEAHFRFTEADKLRAERARSRTAACSRHDCAVVGVGRSEWSTRVARGGHS